MVPFTTASFGITLNWMLEASAEGRLTAMFHSIVRVMLPVLVSMLAILPVEVVTVPEEAVTLAKVEEAHVEPPSEEYSRIREVTLESVSETVVDKVTTPAEVWVGVMAVAAGAELEEIVDTASLAADKSVVRISPFLACAKNW